MKAPWRRPGRWDADRTVTQSELSEELSGALGPLREELERVKNLLAQMSRKRVNPEDCSHSFGRYCCAYGEHCETCGKML